MIHDEADNHSAATNTPNNINNIKNINQEFHSHQTLGQRLADILAKVVGSWPFILIQSAIIITWVGVNVYALIHPSNTIHAWDPYPFILLNLALSFQAAYTGPIVMMSQNRQAQKDRLMAEHDYFINKKSEKEIQLILEQLHQQNTLILEMLEKIKKT